MIYPIILAGGIGSRFWPLSTDALPKQFLNLCSSQPLLFESVKRVMPLSNKDSIYVAGNKSYKDLTIACLKKLGIPKANFLFEPTGKNTFAPIAVLSKIILEKDKQAVIAVFPSDHFIKNKDKFLGALKKAVEAAKGANIVTLGIRPTRPETGFGYIKVKAKVKSQKLKVKSQKAKVMDVEKFIEKPDLKTAKKLIRDKRFYWNAGIFIFQAKTLLDEIKRTQPKQYKIISKIKTPQQAGKIWKTLPSVSVDYAVMERSNKLKLIPVDCGWSDLGSWQAMEEIKKSDKRGNLFLCKNIDLGSKDTLVWSDSRLIATVGLNNLIIVDANDSLLVCAKDKAQEVKKVVEIIRKKGKIN